MDAEQFDRITKAWSTMSHRRKLLTRAVAGLGAVAVVRRPTAAARPGGLCCVFECQFDRNGNRPIVHKCIPDPKGQGPQARCPGSHANCSFSTASAISSCSECPNP